MARLVRIPLTMGQYEAAMAAADRAVPGGCDCTHDEDRCPWCAAYLALVEGWRAARDQAGRGGNQRHTVCQ